jgi:hypothetical protein
MPAVDGGKKIRTSVEEHMSSSLSFSSRLAPLRGSHEGLVTGNRGKRGWRLTHLQTERSGRPKIDVPFFFPLSLTWRVRPLSFLGNV